MPPLSFVSSVYCALPTSTRPRSFESSALQQLLGMWPLDAHLAHVGDVEHAAVGTDGPVLGDDALVLHGHLPAGERNEARPGGDVTLVERRAQEGLHGHDSSHSQNERRPGWWPGRRDRVSVVDRLGQP